MKATSIAVLMTCYNRKNTTLACLDRLMSQEGIEDVSLKVYLVDDGCTDGTRQAVRSGFPNVKVLKGDGTLFWCGGMRLAFSEALKEDFDYYLWLNDDSMLFPHAIRTMLDTLHSLKRKLGQNAIVVGAIQDAQNGLLTYGGSIRRSRWRPLSFSSVEPSDKPEPCDVFNGNCVLIPGNTAKITGNLGADFTHGAGDYDYGLRARAQGFSCWIAPGFVGTSSTSFFRESCKDNAIPIKERVERLSSSVGLARLHDWMMFTRRHGGVLWPICWLRTFVRLNFPWLWVLLRSRKVE